jgi:hypothetical protein
MNTKKKLKGLIFLKLFPAIRSIFFLIVSLFQQQFHLILIQKALKKQLKKRMPLLSGLGHLDTKIFFW